MEKRNCRVLQNGLCPVNNPHAVNRTTRAIDYCLTIVIAARDIAGTIEDCRKCITRIGSPACSGMDKDWHCLGIGVQTRKWVVGKNQIGITLSDIFLTMPTEKAITIRNLLFRRKALGIHPCSLPSDTTFAWDKNKSH
ncbi:hypothetical protein OBA45_00400 [bacterium]|nr:hypothetical protein [bacterium]